MTQHPIDPWRPATAFLSYKRKNADEVKYLQRQLHVRGVQAWRDVTDLDLGSYSQDEIVRAIEQESDAFLLYITPQSFTSDFIWDIEVPAAFRRWQRDRMFNIVPILRGVSLDRLRKFCADRGLPTLTDFNGVIIARSTTGQTDEAVNSALSSIAERTLRAALSLRLRRIGEDRSYEPCICLRTYTHIPPVSSLDLNLDWTEFFPGQDRWPTDEEWQKVLLPALRNVKNVLSATTPSRTLHMIVQAYLPVAVALGIIFPASAYLTLILEGNHGTWSTAARASDIPLLDRIDLGGNGDPEVAVIELAISRDTSTATDRSLPSLGISFGHHLRFVPPGGPGDKVVGNAEEAMTMARQVSLELKRLCDQKGVMQIHLFAALPAALAVLLGHQLNAASKITSYYLASNGYYVLACTLNPLSR